MNILGWAIKNFIEHRHGQPIFIDWQMCLRVVRIQKRQGAMLI